MSIYGVLVDIAILALFFLYAHKNSKLSQITVVIETVCHFLAAVIAVPLANLLAQLSYKYFFRGAIAERIEGVVAEAANTTSSTDHLKRILDSLPKMVSYAAGSYQTLTEESTEKVNALLRGDVSGSAEKIVDILAGPVVEGVFRATYFVILFCGLLYLTKSLGAFLENMMMNADRGSHNAPLGAAMGCIKCAVFVTIVIACMRLCIPTIPEQWQFLSGENLTGSLLFRMFYDQNILMVFLGKGIYPVGF
ncbi:MAG: hypothetical protein E7546_06565 [Ruminococcaceae bacterium]|nr:hypothetical protein [Oscillospiraceae bacterium]